jgi:hypothetical protein
MRTEQVVRLHPAPPVALVPSRGNPHHLRRVSTCACAVIAPLSVGVGLGSIGVLTAVFVACGLIGGCIGMLRFRSVQRCIDRQAERSARAQRESGRQSAMDRASGARQEQYAALSKLVEDIERSDPRDARRFELQELLDYFVRLSVNHQRCVESLRTVGTMTLSPAVIDVGSARDNARNRRCSEIASRRARHHRMCTEQLEHAAEELDAIDELVRLVAQRVASARFALITDGTIERRLAEIDEVDAALAQLSA